MSTDGGMGHQRTMASPAGSLLHHQKFWLCVLFVETLATLVRGAAITHSPGHPHNSTAESTTFLFDRRVMIERDKLVPDVIDAVPKEELFVSYYTTWVNYGNLVGCSAMANMPTVMDWPVVRGAYYTIILTGPDCPSQKNRTMSEYLHWMVTNVKETQFMQGDMMAEYVGAAPNYVTDAHRFLFIVFKQPEPGPMKFTNEPIFDAYPWNEKRLKFSTRKFVKKWGLEAVASNYYWIDHSKPLPTFETWFRTPGDLEP